MKLVETITCYLTQNDCYKTAQKIKPKGVCVHSTGANNPYVRRYVQPTPTNTQKNKLLELLGVNKYSNDWNHPNIDKCVHAFIGKLADDTIAIVQTLPYTTRGWHAGSGKLGSLNDTHISFEICEDSLTDINYFMSAMEAAQKFCAYLCQTYKLDPLGEGVVVCHVEGYRMGKASQHGDIEHWLKLYGLNMDWFRERVNYYYNLKEEEAMDTVDENTPSTWAKEAVDWCVEKKISDGKDVRGYCTREQLMTMLYRYHKAFIDVN